MFKLDSSTKSQAHHPPQFNSCWAHQPPVNKSKVDSTKVVLIRNDLFFKNILFLLKNNSLKTFFLKKKPIINSTTSIISNIGWTINKPFNKLVFIDSNIVTFVKKYW
jgi:hypothetical protein